MPKAFFVRASRYVRYDVIRDRTDRGYPKALAQGWSGLRSAGFDRHVDCAVDLGTGKLFLFSGDSYVRVDHRTKAVESPVMSIADGWGGFAEAGFAESLDAAVNFGSGVAYFFRDDDYLRYDIIGDRVDDGFPAPISGLWQGFAEVGFADSLDAAVNLGTGKVYFFKADRYLRYDIVDGRVDDGYPLPIADFWPGFRDAGFVDSIDAAWVRLRPT